MTTDTEKQEWIQRYTHRILAAFDRWQTPLGIGADYAEHLEQQLADFYDDPLKKDLIEATY